MGLSPQLQAKLQAMASKFDNTNPANGQLILRHIHAICQRKLALYAQAEAQAARSLRQVVDMYNKNLKALRELIGVRSNRPYEPGQKLDEVPEYQQAREQLNQATFLKSRCKIICSTLDQQHRQFGGMFDRPKRDIKMYNKDYNETRLYKRGKEDIAFDVPNANEEDGSNDDDEDAPYSKRFKGTPSPQTMTSKQRQTAVEDQYVFDPASVLSNIAKAVSDMLALCNRNAIGLYVLSLLSTYHKDPMSFFNGKTFHNVALLGDPGTGKTHFANHLCRLMAALHIVVGQDVDEDGMVTVTEATAPDFIAQYAGQSAPQTNKLLTKSLEKVLFIDEAYAISMGGKGITDEGGKGDYGAEVLAAMVKFLGDHAGQIIVIMAGYKDEMQQFLVENAGLPRRFPTRLVLSAISAKDAMDVFNKQLQAACLDSGLNTHTPISQNALDIIEQLYERCLAYYDEMIRGRASSHSNNQHCKFDKSKFMALTYFGNGISSIMNLVAHTVQYLSIVMSTNTRADANANMAAAPTLQTQDMPCLFSFVKSVSSMDNDDQEREWAMVFAQLRNLLGRTYDAQRDKCIVEVVRSAGDAYYPTNDGVRPRLSNADKNAARAAGIAKLFNPPPPPSQAGGAVQRARLDWVANRERPPKAGPGRLPAPHRVLTIVMPGLPTKRSVRMHAEAPKGYLTLAAFYKHVQTLAKRVVNPKTHRVIYLGFRFKHEKVPRSFRTIYITCAIVRERSSSSRSF